MTAPRPEAVELARVAMVLCDMRLVGDHEDDKDVWDTIAERIDSALTAARADEREKCAQIVDQWETAQDAIVTDLNRKLQCTSPHDYAAQCLEGCAAAIRAMEAR